MFRKQIKQCVQGDPCPVWHLGSYEYPLYRGKLQVLFEECIIKSRLILDAGCGPKGRYFSILPPNAWGVGLDIDRENTLKAKKMNTLSNISFITADIQNLPFVENAFDLIVCCDVIEHVKERHKAVKELASVLREKGTLLISTSNMLNPAMFIDTLLPNTVSDKIIRRFNGHFYYERSYRFNPWSLVKKLRECGLFVKLMPFGYPPIGRPWLYEYSVQKLPRIFYLWIVFDKLSNIGFLRKFKETIVVIARKLEQATVSRVTVSKN